MKNLLYTIFCICLVQFFCCCDNEEEQRRANQAERDSLRRQDSAALKVGVMPTLDCLPIVVAKELRLFDTLGVDVHLRYYHALSECRKALTDSIVEGAAIDSLLMNQIKAQGIGLTSALKTDLSWQFLTAKKARISRIAQMSDKIIGADSHGMSHYIAENAIDSMLRHKNYVFIVQVEDVRVRQDMLYNGNIDAALLPEPFATKAIQQGAKVISSVKSKPCGVVAFRNSAMRNKTRQQQRDLFIKAIKIAKDSIKQYGQDRYINMLK